MNSAAAWKIRGEFMTAGTYAERALALYDPMHSAAFAMISPQDPQLTALITLADVLSCLGFLDQARQRCDEARTKARQRAHAHTLALVLGLTWSCEARARSEPSLLLQRAEELQLYTAEHGLPYFAAQAMVYRGLSLSKLGNTVQGLALLMEGLAAQRASEAGVAVPRTLVLLADCYRKADQPKEGLKCLDEAACLIEATQIRMVEADMYHERGRILMAVEDWTAAEASLLQAIDVARRQNAKLFELQAASSLARLWRDQGRRAEARDLLGPIYHWFTEGFGAPDLQDARALLDELG
jgi:tetratricopeptide (TPR) repeat protein